MKIFEYRTFKQTGTSVYTELSSRFLGFAYSCPDEEYVKQQKLLLKKEHHKAVHVVYAFRLGEENIIERSSDDGEPSGSAGKPVLNELKSMELTAAVVFVVRYYGGKKLGVPGLINAYRTAATSAISSAGIYTHEIEDIFELVCGADTGSSLTHVIIQSGAMIETFEYGETCKFVIRMKRSITDVVIPKLSQNRIITITYVKSI